MLVLCLNLGRTLHLPLSKKKEAGLVFVNGGDAVYAERRLPTWNVLPGPIGRNDDAKLIIKDDLSFVKQVESSGVVQ